MQISAHISYEEATHSDNAIKNGFDNTPNADQLDAMKAVAENIFERVRAHFGKPIAVNSFFRSNMVNASTPGSSVTSQHTKGEAIDMSGTPYGVSNKAIFDYIKDNLDYDQLIYEYGTNENPEWVHCSFKIGLNRRQVLQSKRGVKGYLKYVS